MSIDTSISTEPEPKTEKDAYDYDPDAGKTDEERAEIDKQLLRRLDYKLLPWLCLLYLISFLDRANVGNAKVEGLLDDLSLTGNKYNMCLTIFFISYSVFEPLSNVLLKRLRPNIYLPVIMLLWGLVMTLMGLCKNYDGLMAARFFLGLTEAGLFPGINYYLSCWYRRREFGIRAAIFFSSAAISGSFGGLLAAAIAKMDGLGNIAGWAWIFIIEGLATIIVALASFWMVHDFPSEARFLSADDKARVARRLSADKQSSAKHESWEALYFYQAMRDPKTWAACLIYMGVAGALYAFSMFLPSIIMELGYTSTNAQLLSCAPYIVASILTILVGWAADKWNKRGVFNMTVPLIGIAGFTILVAAPDGTPAGVLYAATFLGAAGIYPCISNTITWLSNNVEGVYKRGLVLGVFIGWGNLNGIMGSNVYREEDKPRYRMGHAVVLGYLVIGAWGGSVLMWWLLRRENRLREEGKRDGRLVGKTEVEVEKMGDERPSFRYTL
ncbi:MFS general substrate transporter [Ascobolus immersus RN42]|uniref:MFS general substrate transporter n=1 Tax=Ascobolus immersus RN42 TaxID=1160509 RepID=A0A3N4HW36_ASCIM|nr:MFS general substrate transporter [Ascobolus immersus RN42]